MPSDLCLELRLRWVEITILVLEKIHCSRLRRAHINVVLVLLLPHGFPCRKCPDSGRLSGRAVKGMKVLKALWHFIV